jgi:hypothetical protein
VPKDILGFQVSSQSTFLIGGGDHVPSSTSGRGEYMRIVGWTRPWAQVANSTLCPWVRHRLRLHRSSRRSDAPTSNDRAKHRQCAATHQGALRAGVNASACILSSGTGLTLAGLLDQGYGVGAPFPQARPQTSAILEPICRINSDPTVGFVTAQ